MAAEVTEWIDVDGVATEIDVEWDADGRFMPPIHRVEEPVPLQAGARLRSTRHAARDVALKFLVAADTEAELRTSLRSLVLKMDPTRGDGALRVTAPGGDQRELACRYLAGLEMPEVEGQWSGPGTQTARALFRATEPYWTDVATITATFTTGTPAPFFPIFPLRLASSEVFADDTIENDGDVEVWPVWTIVGPATSIVLRNLTSGKTLQLDYTLAAGDTITIDTRPGAKTVLLDDGTNLFQYLTATSSLWSIARGDNAIRIEASSSTTDTQVVISYKRRYLTA